MVRRYRRRTYAQVVTFDTAEEAEAIRRWVTKHDRVEIVFDRDTQTYSLRLRHGFVDVSESEK